MESRRMPDRVHLRKNIFPRRISDWICFMIMAFSVPALLIFDLVAVVPEIHAPGEFLYLFTYVAAAFLAFNITANWIACVCVDTSVKFESIRKPSNPESKGWHLCTYCLQWAPPRSWHCKICRCCILKRDHHCLFTGCCIGYRNHRYFMVFIVFLFIGSTYALIYNSYYLWVLEARTYLNWLSMYKTLCPVLFFAFGTIHQNIYLIIYNLNVLGFFYATILLLYHGPTVLQGDVCYERGKGNRYNSGWRKNILTVFGNRPFKIWLSPFVRSELPHDGSEWGAEAVPFLEEKEN